MFRYLCIYFILVACDETLRRNVYCSRHWENRKKSKHGPWASAARKTVWERSSHVTSRTLQTKEC